MPPRHRPRRTSTALLPSPTIIRIDPAQGLVPANALRLHVEFDVPMHAGVGSTHVFRRIELFDARGYAIPAAFLEREVWSADGRRLTLHLDAERQRHGWAPGARRIRPVLSAGEWHELRIGPGLLSADGVPMSKTFRHAFRTGPARLARLEPETWKLLAPTLGTSDPLILALPDALDRPHLMQRLRVLRANGARVAGEVRLSPRGTCWAFHPTDGWEAGPYALEIRGRLDDGCGNNVWSAAHESARVRRAGRGSLFLRFTVGDELETGRTLTTVTPQPPVPIRG